MKPDNNDPFKRILDAIEAVNQRLGNLEEGQKEMREELHQGQEQLLNQQDTLALHMLNHSQQIKQTQDILERIEENQNRQDERLDRHWQEIMVLKTKRR